MRVDRRKFLQKTGGLAAIVASGRAPAYAQGTSLHWLRLVDFVPASDVLLRREILPEAEKALGLKITFEAINGRVVRVLYSGEKNATGAPDAYCAPIIRTCLGQIDDIRRDQAPVGEPRKQESR